jgi:hypothetical protein
MNHHDNRTIATGRGARATIGGAAIGTTLAALALALLPGAPATAGGAGDPLHCDQGVCLKYVASLLEIADSDGDGFSDADEKAAGSNPEDPDSHPAVLDLLDLVAHAELPSFENRFSQVVILPEALPDGTKLDGAADLASLSEALGALAPSRKDGLSRLGISSDLMKEMGVGGSDVMSLLAGFTTSKEQPAFEARIGGMRASWISAGSGSGGMSGVGVDTTTGEDGSTHKVVRWFEETDAGTVSFTVDLEMCGSNCTGDVQVTIKGGGQDDECSTVAGIGCFGDLGETADKAYALMKDKEKKDHATPAPGATEPKPSSEPSSQPSTQPSSEPTSQPSPQPTTSESPKAGDGGTYVDPNADETLVVITPADVARVVRIVRGSNTTPAQVDVERPEIEPSDLEDPTDTYAYRDPTYETATFTTVSPVKTGDAVTNYGPDGPQGPRP